MFLHVVSGSGCTCHTTPHYKRRIQELFHNPPSSTNPHLRSPTQTRGTQISEPRITRYTFRPQYPAKIIRAASSSKTVEPSLTPPIFALPPFDHSTNALLRYLITSPFLLFPSQLHDLYSVKASFDLAPWEHITKSGKPQWLRGMCLPLHDSPLSNHDPARRGSPARRRYPKDRLRSWLETAEITKDTYVDHT